MNNQEMSAIWKSYNNKLENIAHLNKQILGKLISTKTERKLNLMKYQSLYGIIFSPLVLVIILVRVIINSDLSVITYLALTCTCLIFGYFLFQSIQYFKLIRIINPAIDSLIRTKEKIIAISQHVTKLQKQRNFIYPLFSTSIILTFWQSINFNNPYKIVFIIGFIIGLYFWGNLKFKLYCHDRLTLIEQDILEIQSLRE